jgi:tyrosinase
MAVVRGTVGDAGVRARYVEGVRALKAERLSTTTADVGIAGPPRRLSTYDLFTVWHQLAMGRMTPPGQADRNAAHSGPAFLPWHRLMLALLELHIQRVLGDTEAALPYWDWAADGDLLPEMQARTQLWAATGIGGSGDPVSDGPFRAGEWRVEIESGPTGRLRATDRPLRRDLAGDVATLPTSSQVRAVLNQTRYDAEPLDRSSRAFRNRVEGWQPQPGPRMHNRVHVWVGGDMAPATSPNDPVFYLNHANVDRLWEAWMLRNGRAYLPDATAPDDLAGHRVTDPLFSLLTPQRITPADVLDIGDLYTYDALP